jgi:extracellular elastinolytic metalloproteinase
MYLKLLCSHSSEHNGLTHAYLRHKVNGKPVFNVVANVAVTPSGAVFTAGYPEPSSIVAASFSAPSVLDAKVSIVDAVSTAAAMMGLASNGLKELDGNVVGLVDKPIDVALGYYLSEEGSLELVYNFDIKTSDQWYVTIPYFFKLLFVVIFTFTRLNLFVSATTSKLVASTNWVVYFSNPNPSTKQDFEYRVVPVLGSNNPLQDGTTLLKNPADPVASPQGWHAKPTSSNPKFITKGNNVDCMIGSSPYHASPSSGSTGSFDYAYNLTVDPLETTSRMAALTNAFYVSNAYHDIVYHYGFTEAAGNFQNDNFGRGGDGWDAILVSAQNQGGTNNANFFCPPDGKGCVL